MTTFRAGHLDAVARTLPGKHTDDPSAPGADRGYVGWSPGDDSLRRYPSFDSWNEFEEAAGEQDPELNLVADYWFEVAFDHTGCERCGGYGESAGMLELRRTFGGRGFFDIGWSSDLTDDDVATLVAHGLLDLAPFGGEVPSAATLNRLTFERAMNSNPGWGEPHAWRGHTTSSMLLLLEPRAERLGVAGPCEDCAGTGYHRRSDDYLRLHLWMLRPRTGKSIGFSVDHVTEADLLAVRAFLARSADRHAAHFAWAVAGVQGDEPLAR